VTSPNGKNPETMSSKGSMVTSSSRDSLYRHFDKLTKEEQVELICTWAHVSARVAHAHVCACMHVLSKHRCNIAPTSSCCTCMHKCTHSHAGSLRRRDKHRGGCRPFARGQTGAQRKFYELVDTCMHTSFAVHLHFKRICAPACDDTRAGAGCGAERRAGT
jgi:hypothetical protein